MKILKEIDPDPCRVLDERVLCSDHEPPVTVFFGSEVCYSSILV